jgi:LacI family transcriptional regulator
MVAFDLWDENLVERLRGAEAHLVPQGYTIRMCTVDSTAGLGACSEILGSGQADGVLLTGLAMPETYPILRDLREEADAMAVPVVALANAFPAEYVGAVADIDDERGAEEAVSHLIQHGHRRILLLGVANQAWAEKRERGYRSALKKAGIPVDSSLIVLGDRSQTWAYNTTLDLANSKDFSAMFAVTDNMAVAAISALKAAGRRVPEDCAAIGFDNNEKVARFTDPPLTTVDNPFYDTGKLASEMLLNMIEKKPVEQKVLPVSFVIRQSCGCGR